MGNSIDLTGRIAVVTGGAQGIGRAIVERLLKSGAAVAIWDRDLSLARKTVEELKAAGRTAAFDGGRSQLPTGPGVTWLKGQFDRLSQAEHRRLVCEQRQGTELQIHPPRAVGKSALSLDLRWSS